MIDESLQELAALYAMGLLEGAEKTAFEAKLATNAELRTLVDELSEASAALAFSAPQHSPSPGLKNRVLQSIASRTAISQESTVIRPPQSVFTRALPWAIAACFAFGAAGIFQIYLTTRTENALLADKASLADIEVRNMRQQLEANRLLNQSELATAAAHLAERNREFTDLGQRVEAIAGSAAASNREVEELRSRLAEAGTQLAALQEKLQSQGDLAQLKIASLASLAGNSPEALAIAVWNPTTQEGVLRVDKLPALATDKDYQLWVIDPAYATPVDGGVFTVDAETGHARINFRPNKPVTNATKFAVSLERKGGVPKAEGPILLLGD